MKEWLCDQRTNDSKIEEDMKVFQRRPARTATDTGWAGQIENERGRIDAVFILTDSVTRLLPRISEDGLLHARYMINHGSRPRGL